MKDLFKDNRDSSIISIEQKTILNKRIEKEETDKLLLYKETYKKLTDDFKTFKNNEQLTTNDKINVINNILALFSEYELFEECVELSKLLKSL